MPEIWLSASRMLLLAEVPVVRELAATSVRPSRMGIAPALDRVLRKRGIGLQVVVALPNSRSPTLTELREDI